MRNDTFPPADSALLAGLIDLLGADCVIGPGPDMVAYIEEPRRRHHVPARAVVRPRTIAQVQALVRFAGARGVALVPQSGNTGLVGGQVPRSGDEVIVNLGRLDAIRLVDAEAGYLVAEAGVTLKAVQDAAEAAGMLFPLSIASEGSARVGGILGSNAGGVGVLAYGNARDLCMGVEAVLADGRLYQGLNALRKDNTGYDLKDLLVGSEGTLGLITAAVLKLYPAPALRETAIASVESPEQALELFRLARGTAGQSLTAFELMPRFGLEIQLRHGLIGRDPTAGPSPWYVLIELSHAKPEGAGALEALLGTALEAELVQDATLAQSLTERAEMWALREQMSDSQSREGASIKNDVSVPISKVPELIARGIEAVATIVPGIRPCPFGHMGDGNVHFNLSQPEGMDPKAFLADMTPVQAAIEAIVLDLGGSISAEHGIGQIKTELIRQVKDPVALDMMRAIKTALDPRGILNPGKVLD